MKYAAGFLPTGNHAHRHGHWETNLCPICNAQVEDNPHIMRCSYPDAILERHTRISEFHQWLLDNNTDSDIARTMVYTLINGPSTKFVDMVPSTASSLIYQAAHEQDLIGWDNFLVGRIAEKWSCAQQQYHNKTSSNPNEHHGISWSGRCISHIYTMVHSVWMYRNGIVHELVEEKLNR